MAGEGESPGLFAETEAVAAGWMLEFTCYALCRHFREGRTRDFERSRDTAQGRRFESDQRISPLESALSIWKLLEEQSKPDNLHEDIHRLILIQAVAIHIERGYFKEATEVLERLFSESESNKALRMKLALIINGNNPDLPFLQSFSYNLLIDKIKSYIDVFLTENSTNFLIKAATKEVETKRLEATMSHDKPENTIETNNESNLETEQSNLEDQRSIANESSENAREHLKRSRKRLYSLAQHTLWKLENVPSNEITKHNKTSCLQSLSDLQNIENDGKSLSHSQTGRKKRRWTWEEDSRLKDGVKKFGVGNWNKILIHYDFNNRTSVMLKDRWRTMIKKDIA
ncbi:telomeric repeat-binding factor 1 isoform X3 [Trachemys scripta elegans]|uniref:telomeric repeat-binding factor 1 isoform X3 n=1 Tax=Trachemys scripta elegans TaxID=31138 RepID=UPI0015536382|nr:telomeric repeat-binding factor 1 isoform X3 [Trachemys scripta elegans]